MSNLDTFFMALDKAEATDSGQKAARDRLHEASRKEAGVVGERLKLADLGKGDFTLYELLFASCSRCVCGAGMAYPEGIGMHGAWYCSAILRGQSESGTTHTPSHPFAFYKIKSEAQPSQSGMTTRPDGTHLEIEPTYACHNCGNTGKAKRYRAGISDRTVQDIVCSECGTQYINSDGSSNSKIHTRYFHVVVSDCEFGI